MRQIRKNIRLATFIIFGLTTITTLPAFAEVFTGVGKVVQHSPDQILVRFKSGVSASSKAIAYGDNPPVATHSFKSMGGLMMLKLPPGVDVETALEEYRNNPNVLYAERDNIVRMSATNDTSFTQLWGLNNTGQTVNGVTGTADADMNVVEAWSNSGVTGSNSVVIGVIDSGVQYNHPDLVNNMWVNPGEIAGNGIDDDANGYVDDIYGINAITNSGNPMDDNNHGTHVAGTIAAVGENSLGITGVNQQAKILACKFLSAAGSGTDSDALKCLDYIYNLKMSGINIVVTNNSWGGTGGGSQSVADAIEMHRNAGILFIAAAGNSTVNNDTGPHYPSNYFKSNIISVAATDQNDGQATFSNYGRRSVHVGAPGVNIYSSIVGSGYSHFQGTSMAAPHVAGLAALLSAEDPTRDWKTIKNLIVSSGTQLAALSTTTTTGRRVRAWDTDGTGAMTCVNQTVNSVVYPQVTSSTKIGGTKLGLAAMNINCGSPAGSVTITTTGPDSVGVVTLLDDGFEFDEAAGDGIYSAYWTAPATIGTYTLTFSNGQTQTVSVIANTSTLQSYRTPVEIAYNPRVDGGGFTQVPGNGYISLTGYTPYFQLPIGGVNSSVIYGIPQGANLLSAPTGAQLTGSNTTIPSDIFETLIAGYWDDLDVATAGYGLKAWFWYNSGLTPVGEAIFEWKGRHNDTGNLVQFQIVYTANSSDIEMHYIASDNSAESATVGIQVDWVRASSQSYNIINPDLATGKAWKWSLDTGAPTADAGIDQNVAGNTLVTLSGIGADPDGGTLNYSWSQTAGTIVSLTGANTLTPSFYAPNVTETLTFKLTVTDDSGQSATDAMNVNVTAGDPAGSLQFSSITYSTNENDGNAVITVTRTGGSGGVVGLSYATGDSSAFSPGDYTYSSGSLSWANGDATSKTFSVPVINDSDVEANETVSLFLLNATGGATLGSANATLTIVNDDAAGTIAFSSATYSVNENETAATITASRTGGISGSVTVDYATADGTASTGSDYTLNTGTLTWADGDSADKTFSIVIADDGIVEDDETVSLTLSNETGGATLGTSSATLTIVNDDVAVYGALSLSSSVYSVNENGVSFLVTVTRTGGSDGVVSVNYSTADITTNAGSDYVATTGTLTWADADSADKTFTIAITDDAVFESDETLSIDLSAVAGGASLVTDSATLTIVEDDAAVNGVLSLVSSTYNVNEDGLSLTVTVERTGGSDGVVSVNYSTADITASTGVDYIASSGILTWANADAASKTFSISISDDVIYEGDETLTVNISSATGGAIIETDSATVTIVEDDLPAPGILSVSDTSVIVAENALTATLTITRTAGSDGAVSVVFASVNGSANAGEDYAMASGTLNWVDGDTSNKTIEIVILDDSIFEVDETFAVGLSGESGGATLNISDATITIIDNDFEPVTPAPLVPGTLSLSSTAFSVIESDVSATISVQRTGGSDGAVNVNYSIEAGSATLDSDFTMTSGILSWADGDASEKTFTVVILNDQVVESDETVTVSISNVTGDAGLDTSNATLTITDDDVEPEPVTPIVSNHPPEVPILIAPADGATGVNPVQVTFDWFAVTDPDGDPVDYLLEYCVNVDFTNCNVVQKANNEIVSSALVSGVGGTGLSLAFLGLLGASTRKQRLVQIAAIIVFSLIMSGCGTNIPIENGDGTVSQTERNLQSNTTYYWKVTATDTNDLSATSEVWSFTTL